jgi:hypothetical protein
MSKRKPARGPKGRSSSKVRSKAARSRIAGHQHLSTRERIRSSCGCWDC